MNTHVRKTVPIEYNHVVNVYRKKSVAKLNSIRQANPALFYHW